VPRRTAALRALGIGASSFAAVVVAHVLDYWLLVPSPVKRLAMLMGTGHSYASRAPVWAIGSAIIGVASVIVLGWSRGRSAADPMPPRRTAFVLTAVQMSGFLAVETIERLRAQTGYASFFGAALALGLAVQVVVALGTVATLWLLRRGAEAVALRFGRRRRTRAVATPAFASIPSALRGRTPNTSYSSRAPPVPLVA
jgi:hypothetical protein